VFIFFHIIGTTLFHEMITQYAGGTLVLCPTFDTGKSVLKRWITWFDNVVSLGAERGSTTVMHKRIVRSVFRRLWAMTESLLLSYGQRTEVWRWRGGKIVWQNPENFWRRRKGWEKNNYNGALQQCGWRQIMLKYCWITCTGKEKS
jgi:hypothetical protein